MSNMFDEFQEIWIEAEEVSTPARDELFAEADWRRVGDWNDDQRSLERADEHLKRAGYLAAAEARLKGCHIEGWDSEWADKVMNDFYGVKSLGRITTQELIDIEDKE